jgi:hypothetical protein
MKSDVKFPTECCLANLYFYLYKLILNPSLRKVRNWLFGANRKQFITFSVED